MNKKLLLILLLPMALLGMRSSSSNIPKSLFSLDEDPRETHYAFEEPLYKQAGHLAWERIKGNEKPLEATGLAVGVAVWKNMLETPKYVDRTVNISAQRITQHNWANNFDEVNQTLDVIDGARSLEAGRRDLEMLQTTLNPERVPSTISILQNPPSNLVVAAVVLAAAGAGVVVHETWGWGCDVGNAYMAKRELTKEKAKATDAYIAHQEEKERLRLEEEERQFKEDMASLEAEEKANGASSSTGFFSSVFGYFKK